MDKKDYFLFAEISKTHGINGKLILKLEEEADWENVEIETIFLEIDGLLVPFFLVEDSFRMKDNLHAIIQLDDINSDQEAKDILNTKVYLSKDDFEFEASENEYLNFLVIDEHEGELGKISMILEYPEQDIFQIISDEKEILIPFNDVFIKKIDEENQILYMDLPEGLIDINI